MNDKCPFKEAGRCDIWLDYQISQLALEDANELAHENWNEIMYLMDRIDELETLLKSLGIEIPPVY